MASTYLRLLTSALAFSSLCACQILNHGSGQVSEVAIQDLDLSSYFAQRLAEGRAHLRANRPGAAITAFRQASADPSLRATAYNGMAIAFDSLDRPDLAGRYFMAAIELAPEDSRFANNFIRFSESRAAVAEEPILAVEDEGASAPESFAVIENPARNAERIIQRESERAVRIVTRAERPAETTQPTVPGAARVQFARRNQQGGPASYPIRFSLADVQRDASSASEASLPVTRRTVPGPRARFVTAPRSRAYPIRVPLDSSS